MCIAGTLLRICVRRKIESEVRGWHPSCVRLCFVQQGGLEKCFDDKSEELMVEAGQVAVGAGLHAMRTTHGQDVDAKTFSTAGRGA